MKYSHKSGSVWITEDFYLLTNKLNMFITKLANLCFVIALFILATDSNYSKIALKKQIIVILLSTVGLILQVTNLIKEWFM